MIIGSWQHRRARTRLLVRVLPRGPREPNAVPWYGSKAKLRRERGANVRLATGRAVRSVSAEW